MILETTVLFKCDLCGAEKRALAIELPEGWKGALLEKTFCSVLCEARVKLHEARGTIKTLRKEAEELGIMKVFEKAWNAPGLEKYANDMSWEEEK